MAYAASNAPPNIKTALVFSVAMHTVLLASLTVSFSIRGTMRFMSGFLFALSPRYSYFIPGIVIE